MWSPHVNCSNYRLSIPSQKSQTKNNLIKVPVQGNVKGVQYQPMTVCLFNAQSVRNKVNTIVDHIIEHNIDVCCITESWLTSEDSTKIAEITPVGYKSELYERLHRPGGGILVVYRTGINFKCVDSGAKDSYEFMELFLSAGSKSTKVLVIYRIPYPPAHRITSSTFFAEIENHLEKIFRYK